VDLQAIADEIVATLRPQAGQQGRVASYIPALARVRADQFGIALCTCDGTEAAAGDCDTLFSIQSVSKLFSLTLCLQLIGESLWERVGREPSGNPFNSLVQLENEQGKPRNPFINAGAIAVADRLISEGRSEADLVAMLSNLAAADIDIDDEVAASEAATGFRNQALANFMKSFGKIDRRGDGAPALLSPMLHPHDLPAARSGRRIPVPRRRSPERRRSSGERAAGPPHQRADAHLRHLRRGR